jgi:hypothetical protein
LDEELYLTLGFISAASIVIALIADVKHLVKSRYDDVEKTEK